MKHKRKLSKSEQQIVNVLTYHEKELQAISFSKSDQLGLKIAKLELEMQAVGIDIGKARPVQQEVSVPKVLVLPDWERLCVEAERSVGSECDIENLFTEEELMANHLAIKRLNDDFNALHRLDRYDIGIAALAGILGSVVDILMVGIPQKGYDGLEAGPLANHVRAWFDQRFPEEEMQKLANSKESKVPFDAQDNRNTKEYVVGLSAYYHRLLSLGHDPLLGFVVGVLDIMNGSMTTIDKEGKFVSQIMENYSDRRETELFAAVAKQIAHLKSDLTTSMGLPAPLMGLFNLLQFGSIGEEKQTIAEIVQGMYYEGYDFIHFCAQSIPVMVTEVVIRLGYALKRIKEGHGVLESVPVSLNRTKHPKLSTMLFIGHSASAAINAGKIYFKKSPMAINYPQWIAFAKYSFSQMRWVVLEKGDMRDAYVSEIQFENLKGISYMINNTFEQFADGCIVISEAPNK